MSADTAPATYDRSAITRARRLGAWGPGLLTKAEGLWRTEVGTYIVAERPEGSTEVVYRLAAAEEASELLTRHGHRWRARQVLRAEAAEADGGEAVPDAESGDAGEAAGPA